MPAIQLSCLVWQQPTKLLLDSIKILVARARLQIDAPIGLACAIRGFVERDQPVKPIAEGSWGYGRPGQYPTLGTGTGNPTGTTTGTTANSSPALILQP